MLFQKLQKDRLALLGELLLLFSLWKNKLTRIFSVSGLKMWRLVYSSREQWLILFLTLKAVVQMAKNVFYLSNIWALLWIISIPGFNLILIYIYCTSSCLSKNHNKIYLAITIWIDWLHANGGKKFIFWILSTTFFVSFCCIFLAPNEPFQRVTSQAYQSRSSVVPHSFWSGFFSSILTSTEESYRSNRLFLRK